MNIQLRQARLRKNKTMEEVAMDVGISLSAYTKYERGERIPRDPIKIALAKYFNRSVQSIFFANQ